MRTILITGAAGFIGHHLVEHLLADAENDITIIDRLDCSGNLNRLAEIGAAKHPRVRFIYHDLKAPINDQLARQIGKQDYILHLAAGTHVDRSITNPMSFVLDNVVATCNVLEFARVADCKRFLYFSTDEVFGPAPVGVRYREDDRYNCGNPYAATKAGGEQLALSYWNTYGLPVIITHTMNVIGERQHPEKFVPQTILKVLEGDVVTIHANPSKTKAGSRFYIHAKAVAEAVDFLMHEGEPGEKYNIVGDEEIDNLDLAERISAIMGCDALIYEMVDFHGSRPGHDLRYALCGDKLAALGWKSIRNINVALAATVQFTLDNRQWLDGKSTAVSSARAA